jgi:glycosyltransferase involved in cell wall biosynthesis
MEGIRKNFKIIALDDGSTDGTWETVQTYEKLLPITPVRNETNKGLGYSLKKLIKIVTDDSKYPERDLVITLESDFTSDAGTIPSMVKVVEEGSDVVIASGFTKGGQVRGAPLKIRLSASILHMFLRNLYAIEGVRDYLSMLRAYRVTVLKKLALKPEDDRLDYRTKAANTELLVRLSGLACRITEIPSVQRYDIRKRESRVRPIQLLSNHIRLIAQYWSQRET